MLEWDIQMEEAIAQYQLIFMSERFDRRIPCVMDKKLFECREIDKIELCVYCLVERDICLDEFKWEFRGTKEGYYFIPSAGVEFEKGIEKITKKYTECKEQYNYLEDGYLTSVYRTCKAEKKEAKHKTCNLIVDMIFNLNRRGRGKKELDNFDALFCCINIFFMHKFLQDATEYMDSLSDEDKFTFLTEVTLFLKKVLAVRKHIDGKDDGVRTEEIKILKELEESSSIIITLLRAKKNTYSIRSGLIYELDDKVKHSFASSRAWKYNRQIGDKSCQDIFQSMASSLFKEIVFSCNDDVKTVEDMLSLRRK